MTTTIDDLPFDILGKILGYAVPSNTKAVASEPIAMETPQMIQTPPMTKQSKTNTPNNSMTLPTFQRVSKSWCRAIRSDHATEAWNIACRETFPGSSASTRRDYLRLHHPRVQSAGRTVQRALCRFFVLRRLERNGRWGEDGRFATTARDEERGGCAIFPCCVCGIRWGDVLRDSTCQLYSCPFVPRSERNLRQLHGGSATMTMMMMYPSWFYRHPRREWWESAKSRFFICGSCSARRPDMAMVKLRCPYLVENDPRDVTVVCFKCAEAKDGMLDHHRILFDGI